MIEFDKNTNKLNFETKVVPQLCGAIEENIIVEEPNKNNFYFLEFKCPQGERFISQNIIFSKNVGCVLLPSRITKNQGRIFVQLVVRNEEGAIVEKSFISEKPIYIVDKSINADRSLDQMEIGDCLEGVLKETNKMKKFSQDLQYKVDNGFFNGKDGDKGDTGAVGPQGLKGDKGDTGAIGPQGLKGDKGDTGAVGPQGLKGDKGDTGAVGPQGLKGDKGDTGAVGPQGLKGDKGDTGAIGPQGLKGDKGDTGAIGPQGLKGDKGDTGAVGPKGLKGDKGDTGAVGPKGLKGDKGADGTLIKINGIQQTNINFASDPQSQLNKKPNFNFISINGYYEYYLANNVCQEICYYKGSTNKIGIWHSNSNTNLVTGNYDYAKFIYDGKNTITMVFIVNNYVYVQTFTKSSNQKFFLVCYSGILECKSVEVA